MEIPYLTNLSFESHTCCDQCNEVVATYINDCPNCHERAGVEPYDLLDGDRQCDQITCDECGCKITLVSGNWYLDPICYVV